MEWVSKGGDKLMPPKELPTNKIKQASSKKDTAINPKKVVKTENPVTKEISTEQPSKRNKDKRKDKTKQSVHLSQPKELPTNKIKRGLPSKKDTAINSKKVVKTENPVTKEISTEQPSKRNKDNRTPRKKWNDNFAQLVEFKKVTGHTDVPTLEGPLGKWVYYQRQNNLKEGKLSKRKQEQIAKLESISFNFELEQSDESMVSALKPVPKGRSYENYAYEDLRTWDMEGPSRATKNHPPLHRWIMMERSKLKDPETNQKPQKTKAKKKGSVKRSAKIKHKNQEQPALIEEDTPDKERAIEAISREGASQKKKPKRKNSTRKSSSVKRKNKNKKPPATVDERALFVPQTVAEEILRDQLLQIKKEESS
jgi:hypothetical protein